MAASDTEKGLTVTADGTNITDVTIVTDIDMRQGTPVGETAWLDGYGASGSYPGSLSGFTASNSDGGANGSLRMVTLRAEGGTTTAGTITFSGVATKVLAIIGTNNRVSTTVASITSDLVVGVTGTATSDADITVLLI